MTPAAGSRPGGSFRGFGYAASVAVFDSSDVHLLRRNWGLLGKAFLPLVAGPAMIVAGTTFTGAHTIVLSILAVCTGFLATLAGIPVLINTWLGNPRPGAVPGRLDVGEGGVSRNGRLVASRRRLLAGVFVPGDVGPPVVRLVRRFPQKPLRFQVPDERTGRAFLSALGLDTAQTVATLKLVSLLRTDPRAPTGNLGCILALMPGIPVSLGLAFADDTRWLLGLTALLALGTATWTFLHLLPARASVGADGVLVEWLWRRRFVPFEDLSRVEPFVDWRGNRGVALDLKSGKEVKLPFPTRFTTEQEHEERTLWVRRIEQAAEIHRLAQADQGVVLPARGERPAAEWVQALRATGSGASADHRTAPLEVDTLFRIVEDPGGEPGRRIAAAIALSASTDAGGKERLRIAASTTAAPELREALELAAAEAASDDGAGGGLRARGQAVSAMGSPTISSRRARIRFLARSSSCRTRSLLTPNTAPSCSSVLGSSVSQRCRMMRRSRGESSATTLSSAAWSCRRSSARHACSSGERPSSASLSIGVLPSSVGARSRLTSRAMSRGSSSVARCAVRPLISASASGSFSWVFR